MRFCGNVIELVEKYKVDTDKDFIKCSTECFNDSLLQGSEIEVYIEKIILPELEENPLLIIDAAFGETNGKDIGMLFMKKNSYTYG